MILAGFLVFHRSSPGPSCRGTPAVINDGFATFAHSSCERASTSSGSASSSFSLTVLTRILALGVIIPPVIAAVAEPLLASLVENYISWFPERIAVHLRRAVRLGTDIFRNGIVFGLWVLALTVAGYIVFERRDA